MMSGWCRNSAVANRHALHWDYTSRSKKTLAASGEARSRTKTARSPRRDRSQTRCTFANECLRAHQQINFFDIAKIPMKYGLFARGKFSISQRESKPRDALTHAQR